MVIGPLWRGCRRPPAPVKPFHVSTGVHDANEPGAPAYVDVRGLGNYSIPPGATVTDAMPTPVMLKPRNGYAWCLAATGSRSGSDNPGYSTNAIYSGYVTYGTAPSSVVQSTGAARAQAESGAALPRR